MERDREVRGGVYCTVQGVLLPIPSENSTSRKSVGRLHHTSTPRLKVTANGDTGRPVFTQQDCQAPGPGYKQRVSGHNVYQTNSLARC